ncbi:MAG TPA: phage tail sheath subtilisin-like domain-containing protein [Ruminiclostridium sp.]|nr:phage tail sheath subtilisin-like domain-containing protein [Ruminiclostridium sp.]
MGLPNVSIAFKAVASSAFRRGERGIVALVMKDSTNNGYMEIPTTGDIPQSLSAANREAVSLSLMGGAKPPSKVVIYVQPTASTDYSEAQAYLETLKWDYLSVVGIEEGEVAGVAAWIKTLRESLNKKVKAVLPGYAADHEGIINFTTETIKVGSVSYSNVQYAPRIAGLLAGTPLSISATFQVLPEVADVSPRLTKAQLDTAIDAGRFEIFNDGEKVKVARAVNSLVTTSEEKPSGYRKIKIVDILDLIYSDIKRTAEDNYIGKYPNSYDNKILLITSINDYLEGLVTDQLLDSKATNSAYIDIDAQRAYLSPASVHYF